jgi:NAD(P)-dependent dehydrogenase (short-subunit alcohol dehydrogenase family)
MANPMAGKTVIVTGANSGIGLATAEALANAGARVLITARDPAKGATAARDLSARTGNSDVSEVIFDLGSLASVRSGAAELLARCDRIDVLVNNAGVVLSDRRVTADGNEMTFAVNHLGPFLLTSLLLDRVRASAPARVVTVASSAHRSARKGIPFDDLQSTRHYAGMKVYGESKLANILFTTELSRRLEGSGVTANCVHPGTVRTGYGADGDSSGFLAFGLKISKPFFLSPEKGARTSVYLASSPDVAEVSGRYFVKCKPRKPSKAALDPEAAARLWEVSEQLVAEVPA